MNTKQEWITDRLPNTDDVNSRELVIEPGSARTSGWIARHYSRIQLGEPWAPYPTMPPPPKPEPKYWSKPSDIPEEVKFMRRKQSEMSFIITSISSKGLHTPRYNSMITWDCLKDFVWYPDNKSLDDPSNGNECICEEIEP